MINDRMSTFLTPPEGDRTSAQMSHITFIGAGNMAHSLIGGMLKQGFAASSITATAPHKASRSSIAALGINTSADNEAAVANADVVVLAVKPQQLQAVLQPLRAVLSVRKPLLISIAAGINIHSLQTWGGTLAIVRCMPNTPALLQLGATGLYANAAASKDHKQMAERILQAVGLCIWVDNEADIDAVTAVSGSGPAYFFLLMEAMQAAAIEQGLTPQTAQQLTLQTALGAASMANNSDVDVAELRRRVSSPGGTTEQAIQTLQQGGFEQLLNTAMKNCADHSKTLADTLGA